MAKKKSATKRLLIIVGVLVLLLIIVGVAAQSIFGGGERGTPVEVEAAGLHTITQVVTASGKVQPEVEVKISPDVSGEIIELPVEEGDPVQRGQLLARIRPDFYAAQREQAEAGVLQAQASLAQRKADLMQAELNLNRQKDLFDKGVISEAEYQTAQTQYEVAEANHQAARYSVQSAEARLREASEQLGKTSIYAPMTGTVSQLNVELGERVVGTSQMQGTEMMRVARLDQMEIEVDVNENDVINIALGDTASVEIDAYPERPFRGVVTEIANSARITGAGSQEQVTNFPVKVRIIDAHNIDVGAPSGSSEALATEEVPGTTAQTSLLRPGMSGTADIFTETVAGVIAIPIQAVTMRDINKLRAEDGDSTAAPDQPARVNEDLRRVVFVVEDGKAQMIEVGTGIANDTHIEIKRGLQGGEQVIIGPYRVISRELEPDQAVQVRTGGPGVGGGSPFAASGS